MFMLFPAGMQSSSQSWESERVGKTETLEPGAGVDKKFITQLEPGAGVEKKKF